MSKRTGKLSWETPVGEVFERVGLNVPSGAYLVRRGGVVAAFGAPSKSSGDSMVMMSGADYDALVDAAGDASDRAAIARGQRGEGHYLPGDVVMRMIKGENRLRVLREHRGLTLDQLSSETAKKGVKVGKANLSHIETGRNKPSVELLAALAKALDVTLEDLLG
jgi:DNA-binding XRE family transcriptional regulator